MFEESVARYPSNIMMWEKRGEKYEGKTYNEMRRAVHECAAGLIDLGIEKGDRLALISEGRNDWVTSELGILYTGAINVPLSVKIEELTDLRFRLAHSGCRMVIVSGAQVQKIRQVKKDLPDLEKVIVLDGEVKREEDEIAFSDVLQRGQLFLRSRRSEFESRWTSVEEHDPANICYTSGTTADPKGIILTHKTTRRTWSRPRPHCLYQSGTLRCSYYPGITHLLIPQVSIR
jgi:long-chain acyl-CoA synthetase